MLTIIILAVFSALMLWAAYSDLTSFTLSNRLCLITALLYPAYLVSRTVSGHGLPLQDILISLAIATVILMVCIAFFALNVMGGGDVKLIPAVALWAGPDHILQYLFITSVLGGIIALIIIVRNRIKTSKYYKSSGNINLSMAEKETSAVPYGVGIAIGGLYVAYQLFTTLNPAII
ncbi:Type IV prepilin peptidase TadV/CpaA [hydrothermal vent metagenome]|uniref:Type IV prepilin peptidase TadV/CpaA n=1 Tax=hydrothermal vent metagenome TaxID=652676 RepID=A0A3B0RKT6_9ZZZZ